MVLPRSKDVPVSIVDRLLLILDLFTDHRSSLTLSEISFLTGLPLSTTSRLLTQMTRSGALVRAGEHKKYRVGPRLADLARPSREPQLAAAS